MIRRLSMIVLAAGLLPALGGGGWAADPPAFTPPITSSPSAVLSAVAEGDEILLVVLRNGSPVTTTKLVIGAPRTAPDAPPPRPGRIEDRLDRLEQGFADIAKRLDQLAERQPVVPTPIPGPGPSPVPAPGPSPSPSPAPSPSPVPVPDPVPDLPADRFGLAKFIADLAATVGIPVAQRAKDAKESASIFRMMMGDWQEAFVGPPENVQGFIHRTVVFNREVLKSDYSAWKPALDKLNARLTELAKAGQIKTLADCAEAWGAIAAGLEYRAVIDIKGAR